jgi:hypothetical protein
VTTYQVATTVIVEVDTTYEGDESSALGLVWALIKGQSITGKMNGRDYTCRLAHVQPIMARQKD